MICKPESVWRITIIIVSLRVVIHFSRFLYTIPIAWNMEAWILDITEKGLQLTGLLAEVGQYRSLLIRADEFHDIFPFAFDALCKWVEYEDGENGVGFEIVDISETGLNELRKLIRLLTIN